MQNLSLGELTLEPGRTLVRRTVTLRRIEAGEVTQIELLSEYVDGKPAQDQDAAPPPTEEP
ncbi:hypothetical protein [Deinococcus humi]|uniref:Uncharacterized protein n=1 Tax=Deinococcus humi TaxID=662880 RepID=A0A7W8K1S2_9DEIO|nr:hypothetical protein [Deinococcus humi]MBB5365694.1 hypothetical protein [Deinococcus humi]GGO37153.1 hypothetical protein GCM10008949_42010 [Deinococcus humi]